MLQLRLDFLDTAHILLGDTAHSRSIDTTPSPLLGNNILASSEARWLYVDGMAFEKPLYNRPTVNESARQLLEGNATDENRAVIENWRNAHFYPHNMFSATLKRKAKQIDSHAVVCERRKRLKSILKKLREKPAMRFTQMQDIAGCRAVVASLDAVYALKRAYQESWIEHDLQKCNDYIAEPRVTGYRSLHLIYAYQSKSQKNEIYNGFKVELQFRSSLQHAWATAVETVGTFRREDLKTGNGSSDWLRFFVLMSSYLANLEKAEAVPGTPSNSNELRDEIRHLASSLHVVRHLHAFAKGLNITEDFPKKADYYVLELDVAKKKLEIKSHLKLAAATTNVMEVETAREASDTVLVRVSDLNALRVAYPNYFADTKMFLKHLSDATV